MTKKYTIYDNDTNTVLFESDNMFEVNNFIDFDKIVHSN